MTRARDVASVLTTASILATDTETAAAISTHAGLSDPHTGYVLESLIDAKGDLIVGSADNAVAKLTAGTDGYFLKSDSEATNGLAWASVPAGYSAPTIGSTSVTSGATVETIAGLTLTSPVINSGFNDQSGTSYTFVLSDNGKIITSSNASAQTFSIPTDATANFATGAQFVVIQIGTAQVTIQAADAETTTILSNGTVAAAPKTRTQYSSITCIKKTANTWYCIGDFA